MRHATVFAVQEILRSPSRDEWDGAASGLSACGWEPLPNSSGEGAFNDYCAIGLTEGCKAVLPTCPACAALVDLALEMRGP